MERLPGLKPNVSPLCKAQGFIGKATGRDHDAAGCTLCCHDAIELANDVDANTLCAPLFALNEVKLAVASKFQIDAAIGAASSGLFDCKPLEPIGLSHEAFEFSPGERVQGLGGVVGLDGRLDQLACLTLPHK
ncbi:hypothetical protein HNQ51_002538 [Inhella inkyongensis]|uniref:Uncharacterized protein n=1 Tax=Inhella inkyongensis TaxID=392593 RepID=A0A840S9Y9_9BURK|nr:hypothetical protein [Inhella inkyongensis]